MGNCQSSSDFGERRVSDKIDHEIMISAKESRSKQKVKLLLLGTGESGKSTIVKQMKIINMGGYSKEEKLNFRQIIYSNIHSSLICLFQAAEKLDLKLEPSNRSAYKEVIKKIDSILQNEKDVFDSGIALSISNIWKDPAIAQVLQSASYIPDSTIYYISNIEKICKPDYIPDDQAILRSRLRTTGISQCDFELGPLTVSLFDVGGQRSERRKWIHCFEGVTSVIFVVAFSEYNQVLLENDSINRLDESVRLFDSIVNARWFLRSSIIFFMNKSDLFKEKLKTFPLETLYPDYNNGPDPSKAGKYILSKFTIVNRQKLKLYPHFTNATDSSQIRVVFSAVKDTLLQHTLKVNGMF